MPFMPFKSEENTLNPAPTVAPNTAGGEARTRDHRALNLFPPEKFYKLTALAKQVNVSPSLPAQTLWTYDRFSPEPTFVSTYGKPILVRHFNQLPPESQER